MDKLASCHAIAELVNWISLMERVIEEDEENLKGAVGSKVIQEYLQRYKVTSFFSFTTVRVIKCEVTCVAKYGVPYSGICALH